MILYIHKEVRDKMFKINKIKKVLSQIDKLLALIIKINLKLIVLKEIIEFLLK